MSLYRLSDYQGNGMSIFDLLQKMSNARLDSLEMKVQKCRVEYIDPFCGKNPEVVWQGFGNG